MSKPNNPIIHDTSAYLFWMLSEQIGFSRTIQEVENTKGLCLFDQSFTMSVLEERGLLNYPKDELSIVLGAIAQEAHQSVLKETNMNGIIYSEDALTGRSPSANEISTEELDILPQRILTNYDIESIGLLCLRHPLPAVVFSHLIPQEKFILIHDTTTSLGFDFPIFLSTLKCQQLNEDLFVLSGTFYIPVPNEQFGSYWNRVIQNSTHFYDELKVQTDSSIIKINAEW